MMRSLSVWLVSIGAVGGAVACASNSHAPEYPASIVWRRPAADVGYGLERFWQGIPATDGESFFFDLGGRVAALDVKTGAQRWVWQYRDAQVTTISNFVVDGDDVLFEDVGYAAALRRTSGELRWRTTRDSLTPLAEPAIDPSALYVGLRGGTVAALDRQTGNVLWTTSVRDSSRFTALTIGVSVAGDTVFAAVDQSLSESGHLRRARVVALNRSTGAPFWTYESPGDRSTVSGAGVVTRRRIIYSDFVGKSFFALDRLTGKEVWRIEGEITHVGPTATPVVSGDTVYVGSNDTYVYAADVNTGALFWKTKTDASIDAIALCGERLLVNNQVVHVLDRRTGRRIHQLLGNPRTDNGFPTSGFGVAGQIAVVAGSNEVVAFRCDR